jgi:predicted transcriptional regulator
MLGLKMAKTPDTRNITLNISSGSFSGIFRRLRGKKGEYNFSGISALRQLLSDERARILHTIKTKDPPSLYNLAKVLGRDFKSVRQDVKLLEKFGFLELETNSIGKREMLKPILAVESVVITVNL